MLEDLQMGLIMEGIQLWKPAHEKIFASKTVSMTTREIWISGVLNGAGLRELNTSLRSFPSASEIVAAIQRMNLTDSADADSYGILGASAACLKKRRGLLNSLPLASSHSEVEELASWAKVLSQVRYRPLRSAVTVAILHQVERVLKSLSFESNQSEASKALSAACASVFVHIALPRSRDTFAVIRQAVAEYLCRWAVANPVVLKSSTLGRTGGLFSPLGDLFLDDDPDVRTETLKGLVLIGQEYPSLKLPTVLVKLLARSYLVRCEEYPDSPEIVTELSLLTELLVFVVTSDPGIADSVVELEQVYQTLWDGRLPVGIRSSVAKLISRIVLGSDIFDQEFTDSATIVDMILAFVQQYTPYGSDTDHSSAFEAFAVALSESSLAMTLATVIERIGALTIYGPLFAALATAVSVNGFLSITVTGLEKLEASVLDVHVLAGIAALAAAGVRMPASMLTALDTVVTLDTSTYLQRYMAYRVWGARSAVDETWRAALTQHGLLLDRHLTQNTLTNIHALESAVERPMADLEAMDKLVDFIAQGEVGSISLLACAVDIVYIQTLKRTSNEADSRLIEEIKVKLTRTLQHMLSEVSGDTSSDAQLIAFLCRYRLGSLDAARVLSKHKGYLDLESKVRNIPVNSYIIASIIESEALAESMVQIME